MLKAIEVGYPQREIAENALFLRYRYGSLGRLQSRRDLSGNLVNVCSMGQCEDDRRRMSDFMR